MVLVLRRGEDTARDTAPYLLAHSIAAFVGALLQDYKTKINPSV